MVQNHLKRDRLLIEAVKSGRNQSDSLKKLFNCYLPLVKSFWNKYYLYGMDFEDWQQEALITMFKGVYRFDLHRQVSFGAFYRSILRNYFYDLIRKRNAKKRVPDDALTSIDVNRSFYADTIQDTQAPCPEHRVLLVERMQRLLDRCSPFEKEILISVSQHRSVAEIARFHRCSKAKIMNAFGRCRRKFERSRWLGA